MNNKTIFKVRAPLSFNGGHTWGWSIWIDSVGEGNKHKAIQAKMKELGANACDYSQSDYMMSDWANF